MKPSRFGDQFSLIDGASNAGALSQEQFALSNELKKLRPLMPATMRQTAGPGFNFEDLTSAWLVSKILLGQRLQGVGTEGAVLQSQTSSMGWMIDDLLVSTKDGASHLAISCKSNVQVSRNGFPKDFVDLAWKQWKTSGGSMQNTKDCLGLVTRGRHPAFDPVWADITRQRTYKELPVFSML